MNAARSGDLDVAARCELSLLGVVNPADPTPEQIAGASLRAWQAWEIHCLRVAWSKEGT